LDSVPLGEFVALRRGFDLPRSVRRPGDVPVVSSCGVSGRHDTARVPPPGVVTGRTGTLGEVFFLDRSFWPLNTTYFVSDFKGNDPRFAAYALRSLDLARHDGHAAIPGVSRGQLYALPVPRPPLRRQREIAAALARLDRRAALLERMERTLAAMADACFALAGSGRRARVEDLCARIGNGRTPPRRDPRCWGGDLPWYRSGELDDGPLVHAAERVTGEARCRRWPAGTVVVAMYARPTVGRLGVLAQPAALNQACCALVPEAGAWTLFHALKDSRARLADLAGGAVQQSVSQRVVREHEVRVPEGRALEARIGRLHALRAAHRRELLVLRAWRDARLADLLQR